MVLLDKYTEQRVMIGVQGGDFSNSPKMNKQGISPAIFDSSQANIYIVKICYRH